MKAALDSGNEDFIAEVAMNLIHDDSFSSVYYDMVMTQDRRQDGLTVGVQAETYVAPLANYSCDRENKYERSFNIG